jgi:flavodoxin
MPMKTIILYASKSGNTKKIADSMAAQLNCEAIKVTSESNLQTLNLDAYDLILVGTGLYAGTPNEDLTKFLSTLKLESPKQFALFITWGGAPRSDKMALERLRTLLLGKGQKVLDEQFAAYGGWKGILMKSGHPKPDEIKAAGEWAKKLVQKIEG